MKFVFFAAALIFSACVLNGYAQESTESVEPSAVVKASPTPEIQSSVTAGPKIEYPAYPSAQRALSLTPAQQSSPYVRPDAKTRFKRYVNGTVGPYALARQVAGAGISTWRNSPEEWGGQREGFGKRLASNFGKNLIKQTTVYGLDEALKLDSHYYPRDKKDIGSRIKNALISLVTARNSRGKRVIGVPRIVGTYASSITAAETWYPDRYDWKDGVRSGTISLGVNAAFNLFKEFVWKK